MTCISSEEDVHDLLLVTLLTVWLDLDGWRIADVVARKLEAKPFVASEAT